MSVSNSSKYVLIALTCYLTCACNPLYYTSDNISGKIINSDTGKPIKDAIVIANWDVHKPRFLHGSHYKNINKIETITNTDGEFILPSWGPNYSGFSWHMTAHFPRIFILKENYMPTSITNYSTKREDYDAAVKYRENSYEGYYIHTNIDFYPDNLIIKLEPVTDIVKYTKFLSALERSTCDYNNFRRTPLCFYFYHNERKRLSSLGVRESITIDNKLDRMNEEDKLHIINHSKSNKSVKQTD